MTRSYIESIGVALPSTVLTTQEVLEGCSYHIKFPLEEVTGIHSRRVVGPNQFAFDLAYEAAQHCLKKSTFSAGDIELLIATSISHWDCAEGVCYEPSHAAKLRHALGCKRAWAFDVSNACAGLFTGIFLADALIRAGRVSTALIVSGEYITHLLRTAQKEIASDSDPRIPCLTLGDAGSAVLLTKSQGQEGFEHISLQTIGAYHSLCVAGPTDRAHGGAIMKTDMLALSDASIRASAEHALEVLEHLGYRPEDLELVIPHQTSAVTIYSGIQYSNKLWKGNFFNRNNVINNLGERGNTSTTTHLLALTDEVERGRIESQKRIAFSVAGSGICVGLAVYELGDLPQRLKSLEPPKRAESTDTSSEQRPVRLARPVRIGGMSAVPISGELTSTLELLREASTACLQAAQRNASDIELLIHTGVYRSGMIAEPAIASVAAGELGFDGSTSPSGSVLGFDLTNGGGGMLDACRLASLLIDVGAVQHALVMTSEVEERAPASSNIPIAQCGAALFLEANNSGTSGFIGFHTRHFDELIGLSTSWAMQKEAKAFIYSEGRELLQEHCIQHMPAIVAELLEAMQIDSQQIKSVIVPTMSSTFAASLQERWPEYRGRIAEQPWTGADLHTASFVYGLHSAAQTLNLKEGNLVLLSSVSAGMQIGLALYRM